MAQIDYVRVVDEDGIEQSVPVKKYEVRKDQFSLVEHPAADEGGAPIPAFGPGDLPAKNASVDDWREFTRSHAGARGLSPEQVDQMTRDDMSAAFVTAPAKSASPGTAATTKEN